MKSAFHTPLPIAVRAVNLTNGIRSTPAGTDTMLRTRGMHRPISTINEPWRSKNLSPRARSAVPKRGNQRFEASMVRRSMPTRAPMP